MVQQKKNVLIVDDEPDFLDLLRTLLKDLKLNAVLAKDGKEALTKCDLQDFDLVITDLRMPNMDGNALIHELRKKEKTKNVPVIIVSSHFDEKSAFYHSNMYCMSKPFDELHLLEIVQTGIAKKPFPKYTLGGGAKKVESEPQQEAKPVAQASAFPVDHVMEGLKISAITFMSSLGLKAHCGQRVYIPIFKVETLKGVGAIIELSVGPEKKRIGICFDEDCFTKLMGNMLMVENATLDAELVEGAGEVMNQVIARAGVVNKFNLGRTKPSFHMSLAQIIDAGKANCDVLPFSTTHGKFSVFLFDGTVPLTAKLI